MDQEVSSSLAPEFHSPSFCSPNLEEDSDEELGNVDGGVSPLVFEDANNNGQYCYAAEERSKSLSPPKMGYMDDCGNVRSASAGDTPSGRISPPLSPSCVQEVDLDLDLVDVESPLSPFALSTSSSDEAESPLSSGDPHQSLLAQLSAEYAPSYAFIKSFLQSIFSSLESRDPVVANAWMETLLDVIDLLPEEMIRNDVLTLAVHKSQRGESVSARLLCCRMLGKMAAKFDAETVQKELIPLVQTLCEDEEPSVRSAICRQLPLITAGLGDGPERNIVLPMLVEMANDREITVKFAIFETLVHLVALFDNESLCSTIIPLVRYMCQQAFEQLETMITVVAKQLAPLCCSLRGALTTEQAFWFVELFGKLCSLGSDPLSIALDKAPPPMPDVVPAIENHDRFAECRGACAYNFPAMVMLVGASRFSELLLDQFRALCRDRQIIVRRTMACSLHEVANLLDDKSHLISPEIISLLTDDSPIVLEAVVAHLDECLHVVFGRGMLLGPASSNGHTTPTQVHSAHILDELIGALKHCCGITSRSSNWRLYEMLLVSCSALSDGSLPVEQHGAMVELLYNELKTARAIPCRMAASQSLLIFLKYWTSHKKRMEYFQKLIDDFGKGSNCHRRMQFIRMCDQIMTLFSKRFFKQHFFEPLLALADDRVANIRLKVCEMLPDLKVLFVIPEDEDRIERLESVVKKVVTTEKDRDVVAAIRNAIEDLTGIEVLTESMMMNESNIDVVDLQKEAFEKKWNIRPKAATLSRLSPPKSDKNDSYSSRKSSTMRKTPPKMVVDRPKTSSSFSVPSGTDALTTTTTTVTSPNTRHVYSLPKPPKISIDPSVPRLPDTIFYTKATGSSTTTSVPFSRFTSSSTASKSASTSNLTSNSVPQVPKTAPRPSKSLLSLTKSAALHAAKPPPGITTTCPSRARRNSIDKITRSLDRVSLQGKASSTPTSPSLSSRRRAIPTVSLNNAVSMDSVNYSDPDSPRLSTDFGVQRRKKSLSSADTDHLQRLKNSARTLHRVTAPIVNKASKSASSRSSNSASSAKSEIVKPRDSVPRTDNEKPQSGSSECVFSESEGTKRADVTLYLRPGVKRVSKREVTVTQIQSVKVTSEPKPTENTVSVDESDISDGFRTPPSSKIVDFGSSGKESRLPTSSKSRPDRVVERLDVATTRHKSPLSMTRRSLSFHLPSSLHNATSGSSDVSTVTTVGITPREPSLVDGASRIPTPRVSRRRPQSANENRP